jgi:hypothetical protein
MDTTKDGLLENTCFDGVEDHHGRIWFMSNSNYLFYYQDGMFHTIAANPELKRICEHIPNLFFYRRRDTIYYATRGFLTGYLKFYLRIITRLEFIPNDIY